MKRFFLEVLTGVECGKKVEVRSSVTLGRSRGNDLAFAGDESGIVSGRHALVALKAQALWLRDLDSRNGTFVGKTRVTERELLGGEIISLGHMGPALRVEVSDQPFSEGNTNDTLLARARETTTMPRVEVGLLSGQPKSKHSGNRSLILEMAKRLRRTNSPQDVMQGMLSDPDRIARLLRGGVMPERVANWVGTLGSTFARSRKRVFWIGGGIGMACLIALSVLGYQNLGYRGKLKKQGSLLGQIHALEQGLDGIGSHGAGKEAEKAHMVRQLLAAEKQLFQIREKLRLPDRIPTYDHPLGADVHKVLEELGKKGFIVPESFIRSVQGQIDYFCKPENRATLIKCFQRKPRYEKMINQELTRMKLPSDFLYIAMQESLLDSAALSGNDARGLWQMVPITAREYDLNVPDDWQSLPAGKDERTRTRPATRAAAKYLHLLYSEFGDAALVMAAYNAGSAKMRHVLRQIEDPVNDRDFWYLYRMGFLPEETNQYVPKIIAMILIDREREKYGFKVAEAKVAPGLPGGEPKQGKGAKGKDTKSKVGNGTRAGIGKKD